MNVLVLGGNFFGLDELQTALVNLGHVPYIFTHPDYKERFSDNYVSSFKSFVETHHIDFCFSFNYSVLMAKCCHELNKKYISVVYDSPLVSLFSYTLPYPTNYVFCFDSALVNRFCNGGIQNIFYIPLMANIHHMGTVPVQYQHDISFIGSLYDESHNFYDRLTSLDDYSKGYIEGLINAQMKVYGANFIEESLTPNIIESMQKACPYPGNTDGIEPDSYIYAQYFINRKTTSLERKQLLSAVGKRYGLDMYTKNPNTMLPGVVNHGPADYYDVMPYVFAGSKINLNITLRSITSGIPLRCLDIMSCGGFLLTNFQSDFLNHFVPNEDFIYFESEEDMLSKIEYYLAHDAERKEIAANGKNKISESFSFECRLFEIIDFVFK